MIYAKTAKSLTIYISSTKPTHFINSIDDFIPLYLRHDVIFIKIDLLVNSGYLLIVTNKLLCYGS